MRVMMSSSEIASRKKVGAHVSPTPGLWLANHLSVGSKHRLDDAPSSKPRDPRHEVTRQMKILRDVERLSVMTHLAPVMTLLYTADFIWYQLRGTDLTS